MTVSQPYDRKAIEDALRLWLETSSGINWIRANQSSENPRPSMPYGTYALRDSGRIGGEPEESSFDTPAEQQSGAGGDEVTVAATGLRRLVLSCNVYGRSDAPNEDPAAYCEKAICSLSLSSFRDPLNDLNISVIDPGNVRDLDRLENEAWLKRSQFDSMFSVVAQVTERTGYVETIEVSGFKDAEQTVPFWQPNPQTFQSSE